MNGGVIPNADTIGICKDILHSEESRASWKRDKDI